MSRRRNRILGLSWLGVAVAASCSVFPDEATLPARPGMGGEAGEGSTPEAGTGGTAPTVTTGGAAGGPTQPMGGAPVVAGSGPGPAAGAGGEGGTVPGPACDNPQLARALALEDTWIGSAKSGTGHGNEKVLSVVVGTDEHRMLIALELPKAIPNAALRSATLRFNLASNADVDLAGRELSLHRLTHPLIEGRATWINYANGANAHWDTPGGDFGPKLAGAAIAAGTSSGNVDFDVTEPVSKIIGAVEIPLSLIVRETTQALPAPAELVFTSTEDKASPIPELLLVFCDP